MNFIVCFYEGKRGWRKCLFEDELYCPVTYSFFETRFWENFRRFKMLKNRIKPYFYRMLKNGKSPKICFWETLLGKYSFLGTFLGIITRFWGNWKCLKLAWKLMIWPFIQTKIPEIHFWENYSFLGILVCFWEN